MKAHFTLMVKRLLEYLHVKNLDWGLKKAQFPLVGDLAVVIHSKVQSVHWKFMLLVRRVTLLFLML